MCSSQRLPRINLEKWGGWCTMDTTKTNSLSVFSLVLQRSDDTHQILFGYSDLKSCRCFTRRRAVDQRKGLQGEGCCEVCVHRWSPRGCRSTVPSYCLKICRPHRRPSPRIFPPGSWTPCSVAVPPAPGRLSSPRWSRWRKETFCSTPPPAAHIRNLWMLEKVAASMLVLTVWLEEMRVPDLASHQSRSTAACLGVIFNTGGLQTGLALLPHRLHGLVTNLLLLLQLGLHLLSRTHRVLRERQILMYCLYWC